ncbi:hypothetical protein HXX76_001865 [Chlamydomonas incerta]|uniref:BTB domain-containing protein n=1 Tax=Chlamydomonas incerta TaxID=51695 RepID=A0A835TDL0_CHLIN|nr:hypothetical protein HXX76_001865 [Chlamydomonas incerta]|eukprot:KAG2443512.1 hypothetical protein HXX76_001865 [Chlamydomonas incerta]
MDAALGRFKSGSLNFQTLISELVAATEAERQQLEEARRQLDEERHAWELERQRMHTILNDAEQVTLNVGGLRFTTSLSTLRNAPSPCLFNAMFSGRHKLTKDEAGCYFIDRDGRHFHDILNYLRDGNFNFPGPSLPDPAHHHHHHLHAAAAAAAGGGVGPGGYGAPGAAGGLGAAGYGGGGGGGGHVPLSGFAGHGTGLGAADVKYLLELRAEANYYGLTGLMAAIDRYPHGLTRVARAAALNVEDSWMYEDGQDEIVFSVDKAVALLGVGLCGTEGGLTVELELYEVDAEDFSRELATLSSCAQSFTKADGAVLRLMLTDPVALQPGKFYMLSALIKGAESFCCEECLDTVITAGVTVSFHPWESPNGTSEHRGQFPELYIRLL